MEYIILRHGQKLSMPLAIMNHRNSECRMPGDLWERCSCYNDDRKKTQWKLVTCIFMGGAFDGCPANAAPSCFSAVLGLPVPPGHRALCRQPVPDVPHDGAPAIVWRSTGTRRGAAGAAR